MPSTACLAGASWSWHRRTVAPPSYPSSGRLSRGLTYKLGVLNGIVLHTLHSTDRRRSARRLARVYVRDELIGLAADVLRGRWALPTPCAYLFGLSKINEIINMSSDKLNDYYSRYQRKLIKRAKRTVGRRGTGRSAHRSPHGIREGSAYNGDHEWEEISSSGWLFIDTRRNRCGNTPFPPAPFPANVGQVL